MSMLFIPLALIVWIVCYGPLVGESADPLPPRRHRGPIWCGGRSDG